MLRTWCCYTLALAALALHAGSSVAQELRYKFTAGSKNSYVMEQNQTMKMSAMGQEFEIKINMSMELSQAIDKVDTATGKPANHLPTTASCDACHKRTTWVGP